MVNRLNDSSIYILPLNAMMQMNHFNPDFTLVISTVEHQRVNVENPLGRRGNALALTHEGSSVVAGPCLHGAGAVRVASSQRLGDRRRGLAAGVACPAQNELQCGSLRKRFKRRQSLRGRRQTTAGWLVGHSVTQWIEEHRRGGSQFRALCDKVPQSAVDHLGACQHISISPAVWQRLLVLRRRKSNSFD